MNTNAKIAVGFVGLVILLVIVSIVLAIGSPAAAVEHVSRPSVVWSWERQ